MALIKIDVTDIVANVTRSLPTRADLKEVQRTVAGTALDFWKNQAKQKLRSSSMEYQQALSMQEHGQNTWLVLTGMLPNMIENGWDGGDMREWMLKGPNAKMGARGMYNTIPFQHGTPGTTGRYVGEPMPPAIYKAVQALKKSTRSAPTSLSRPLPRSGGQPVLYGTRLKPGMRGMSKQVTDILNTKKKPHHTTSIYTGMTRAKKKYVRADQTSGYMTFRRISRGGDPASWIHKGIKPPRHFAKETQKYIEENLPAAIRAAIGGGK